MKALILVLALAVLTPLPAHAQMPDGKVLAVAGLAAASFELAQEIDKVPPFPTAGEQRAAAIASWMTSLAPVALDARVSWQCPDRVKCFEKQGVRVGVVYGALFMAHQLVHRDRPCAPDCGIDNPNGSWFSGHTAIAFSAVGGPSLSIVLPLAIGTGALRVGAKKHFVTDVITGALVGGLASRIR